MITDQAPHSSDCSILRQVLNCASRPPSSSAEPSPTRPRGVTSPRPRPGAPKISPRWLRPRWRFVLLLSILVFQAPPPLALARASDALAQGFANPPTSARLRAYWWWLNGCVTKTAITRDLEEMKAKGFGGALICDAGGAEQDGNDRVPHGPTFFSPEWRELYKHALREADRLGLEMSLNIQSGWNLGGPMVKPENAPKKLIWTQTTVQGPVATNLVLPAAKGRDGFYRDIAVLAYPKRPTPPAGTPPRKPLKNGEQKALLKALHFSAPDTSPLFDEYPAVPGEEDARAKQVVDLTRKMSKDGVLAWKIPAGAWEILRFGCTLNDSCRVSTCSEGWQGYALDPFDAKAFQAYWDQVVEPLIADAGPLAGRVLKYLHTDSWEVEVANWTPTLREEFRRRRGYDLLPFLPVVAGRIIDSRPVSNRFLHDLRRTMGDLAIANHYRLFVDGAHRHGLQIHPESGGPHAVPIDAQQCLGMDDAPMSEFWAWSWRHRIGDSNRFFVKQPASAAHSYGHRLVLAEGFTTIGPHWQERLADNLKPAFDQACCEGLNLLVWHAFVCSPQEQGLPGIQYFAGTHFNPNSTWWNKSAPFLAYIDRCQFLLQQGLFVADACSYYGDHVPNFAQLKRSDPARVLPGYDYDVVTAEVLLGRMSVRDGRLVLPDGMSYRVLVLPDRPSISLPVLRKIRKLVEEGATVIGPKPAQTHTLTDYPHCDAEVRKLADALWDVSQREEGAKENQDNPTRQQPNSVSPPSLLRRSVGKGRVFSGLAAREVLSADGIKPDFECSAAAAPVLDYIHRRDDQIDIYFVANRSNRWEQIHCTFRVAGRTPELWDPVSGRTRDAAAYSLAEGRTTVPLEFAPYGSLFVVFRRPLPSGAQAGSEARRNFPAFSSPQELTGPWRVRFDPKWGGPESVEFDRLTSWTNRPETGIKYFSGTATYQKTFDLPDALRRPGQRLALELGEVRNLAEVRLNGKNLGILWAVPFRVEVTDAVKPAGNELEIDVVNFWPNRIIGDQLLPPEKRFTRTNIRKLTKDTPLEDSGLLGPVRLLREEPGAAP